MAVQFTDETPADDASLSAADRAYHWMRDAILSGHLAAGSSLNERELAEKIGVSRTPVREALRRLEQQGMAKARHNAASTVVTWTRNDIHEVFQLRATLEGLVASIAATRATPGQIAELGDLCDAMETAFADHSVERTERLNQASAGNERFHKILLDATESERLGIMLSYLSNTPYAFRTYRWFSDTEVLRSLSHHRDIVGALRVRDADWAASSLRAHIMASRANLLSRVVVTPKQGRGKRKAGKLQHDDLVFAMPSADDMPRPADPGPVWPQDRGRGQSGEGSRRASNGVHARPETVR